MSSSIFIREFLDSFLDAIPFIQPGRKRVDWTLNLDKLLGEKGPADFLSIIHLPVGFHKAVFRQASWGLLHSGIPHRRDQYKYIHTPAETLLDDDTLHKVMYQPSERCLIPMSGFNVTWEGGRYRILPATNTGFLVAGLMSPWGRNLEVIHTFTAVTTPASEDDSISGDRLPAIVDSGTGWRWLTERDPAKALALLQPPSRAMLRISEEESEMDEPESLVSDFVQRA